MKIHTPAMKFLNAETEALFTEGHAKNSDPYGRGVYMYASEWATQMQEAIDASGIDQTDPVAVRAWLDANAETVSHKANTDGITGFMYGCAVSIVAAAWLHGEQLRRWHNKETQIGTEGDEANKSGGVLNPAVLVVGKKE